MMAQKYLHELLEEDQEPFILHKYISDRRSKIKTQIYPRKTHKPLHQNSNFPTNLCKNVCLFSFPETTTQELRKSPLFDFQSPKAKSKSPIKFQIPSRTANLLLEAALKIQKHSSSKTKSSGFSLFGSLFKRLTQRSHKRKEIEGSDLNLCVKDILKWESRKLSNGCMKEQEKLDFCNGRSSSAVWSESNEDKSLDMETWSSSSSRHCDDDCEIKEIEFVTNHHHKDNSECACCHDINGFCDSPFCFVLQKSPSFDRYTSELPSSTPSPNHHNTQDKESNGGEEEKEDKEHCSPVCVLDPPFKDDEESHGNDEEDSSNLRCSYAIIERAKQQLLYKLSRFEKLAELDPLELEKRMLEDEDENDYETLMENDDSEVEGSETSCKENEFMQLVFEAVCHSSVHEIGQIPKDLKKLVFDLIMEEDREHDKEIMIKRVCKRLELWKEVESNTIDMMIEEDFTRENERWKKNMMEIRHMASEIEVAIFSLLVEEFSKELVC